MMLSALGGAGVVILISGGWLARSGALLFERQQRSELVAGLPIIWAYRCEPGHLLRLGMK
jgi:hypothetical protein